MAVLLDVPVGGFGEFIVDEEAGTLTIELKGTVLGQAEDLKIPLSLVAVLTPIMNGISNPFVKWALGLIIGMI